MEYQIWQNRKFVRAFTSSCLVAGLWSCSAEVSQKQSPKAIARLVKSICASKITDNAKVELSLTAELDPQLVKAGAVATTDVAPTTQGVLAAAWCVGLAPAAVTSLAENQFTITLHASSLAESSGLVTLMQQAEGSASYTSVPLSQLERGAKETLLKFTSTANSAAGIYVLVISTQVSDALKSLSPLATAKSAGGAASLATEQVAVVVDGAAAASNWQLRQIEPSQIDAKPQEGKLVGTLVSVSGDDPKAKTAAFSWTVAKPNTMGHWQAVAQSGSTFAALQNVMITATQDPLHPSQVVVHASPLPVESLLGLVWVDEPDLAQATVSSDSAQLSTTGATVSWAAGALPATALVGLKAAAPVPALNAGQNVLASWQVAVQDDLGNSLQAGSKLAFNLSVPANVVSDLRQLAIMEQKLDGSVAIYQPDQVNANGDQLSVSISLAAASGVISVISSPLPGISLSKPSRSPGSEALPSFAVTAILNQGDSLSLHNAKDCSDAPIAKLLSPSGQGPFILTVNAAVKANVSRDYFAARVDSQAKLSCSANGVSYLYSRSNPSFQSLALIGAASEGLINAPELSDAATIVGSLSAKDYSKANYALQSYALNCDGSLSYLDASSITAKSFATLSDGDYKLCVQLKDDVGSQPVYGASAKFSRHATLPSVTALSLGNDASDGFLNAAEVQRSLSIIGTLTASNYATVRYKLVLDSTSCDGSVTGYSSDVLATDSLLVTSGASYKVCAELKDAYANPAVYGASSSFILDLVAPSFSSVSLAGAASDNVINSLELSDAASLISSVVASGATRSSFAVAAQGSVCDKTLSYQTSIKASAFQALSDGSYQICVQVLDQAGNAAYGSSAAITLKTTLPQFTSLALAALVQNGYLNAAAHSQNSTLTGSLVASGYSTATYAVALSTVTCSSGLSYHASVTADDGALNSHGQSYKVCVRLDDGVQNPSVYGSSAAFVLAIQPPSFVSLSPSGVATDLYVNLSEKNDPGSIVGTLTASGYSTALYALVTTATTCDNSLGSYSSGLNGSAFNSLSDGNYKICVKLTDLAGNMSFGASSVIKRKVALPSFSALALGGNAQDGIITASEQSQSSSLLGTLTALNYDVANYVLVGAAVNCDNSLSYLASDILSNDAGISVSGSSYKICVKLTDYALNPPAFGASGTLVLNVLAPNFSSIVRVGVASDGYVLNSEIADGNTIVGALSASSYDSASYALQTSTAACDNSLTYSGDVLGNAFAALSDGSYKLCVKLVNSNGLAFGASANVVLKKTLPTFTSLSLGGDAADGYINSSEHSLHNSMVGTLAAQAYDSVSYKLVNQGTTCNSALTYGSNVYADDAALVTSGASYKICIVLSDTAGNPPSYGASSILVLDLVAPTFTSLALGGVAADGYVNNADKSDNNSIVGTLTASAYSTVNYALAASATACDNSLTYSSTPLTGTAFSSVSDGSYKICVQLLDAALNPAYGASPSIVRKTTAISFSSLALAGNAADGYINATEVTQNTSIVGALVAANYDSVGYKLLPSATTCDATPTYGADVLSNNAAIVTSGATYKICVELKDSAGNPAVYGASANFTFDSTPPTFISLGIGGVAIDSFINNAEQSDGNTIIGTLNATGYASFGYALTSSGTACDINLNYAASVILGSAFSALSDGVYKLCVRLTDISGNIRYGGSSNITKKASLPSFTSLAVGGAASDGYINSAESAAAGTIVGALVGSNYDSVVYKVVTAATTCDNNVVYGGGSVLANDAALSSSGTSYKICVKLSDSANNPAAFGSSSTTFVFDTVAPLPSNVSVQSAYVNTNTANASWTAAPDSDTKQYQLKACTDSGCTAGCSSMLSYNTVSSKATSALSDGVYYLCVRGEDNAGNFSAFVASSSTTTIDTTAPTAPTPVQPSNLHTTTYTATWTRGTDLNRANDEAKMCTDAGCSLGCTSVISVNAASGSISGLADGVSYRLCVRTTDLAGNASAWVASAVSAAANALPRVSVQSTTSAFDERTGDSGESWWNNSYTKRRKLKFQALNLPENLTNFPVLVVLNSARVNYSLAGTNGVKLHFVDADGSTVLAQEVEKWDSSGRSYVWVKVPQIDQSSASDFIWMYYDGPDETPNSSVWGSYYGVWHLDSSVVDRSGNVTGSSNSNPVAPVVDGIVGKARSFNATQYIDTNYIPSTSTTSGFSLWLKPDESYFCAASWNYPTVTNTTFQLCVEPNKVWFQYGNNSTHNYIANKNLFLPHVWTHIAVVKSGTTDRLYRNGMLIGTATSAADTGLVPFYLGRRKSVSDTSWLYSGAIDEFRFYPTTQPSGTRIKAEYLTARDALIAYGKEEDLNNPVLSTITAQLDTAAQETITVPYTVGGTATALDHNLTAGNITFAAGSSTSNLSLKIYRDTVVENPAETVSITLGTPTGAKAVLGASVTHTKTITEPVFDSCEDLFSSGLYYASPQAINISTANYTGTATCDFSDDAENRPWTLLSNYLHKSGTSPAAVARTTSLPLQSSSTLGVNESGQSANWGHTDPTLFKKLNPTELRFYCKSDNTTDANGGWAYNSTYDSLIPNSNSSKVNNGRIVSFATNSCLGYFSVGSSGTCKGIESNFTPLAAHTGYLPAASSAWMGANGEQNNSSSFGGTFAMINHPFYNSYNITFLSFDSNWECDDFTSRTGLNNTLHRIWGQTQTTAPSSTMTSCKAWRDAGATRSGVYWLYDSSAPTTPYKAYCDMEAEGGGWTLVLKSMANNSDFLYSSAYWAAATPEFNVDDFSLNPANSANAIYPSYKRVAGNDIRIVLNNGGHLNYTASATARTASYFANNVTLVAIANSSAGANYCGDWPSLMGITTYPTWELQSHAGALGTNLNGDGRVRFGILANNETNAVVDHYWDSALGFGVLNFDASGNIGSGIVTWGEFTGCNILGKTTNTTSAPAIFKQGSLWIR